MAQYEENKNYWDYVSVRANNNQKKEKDPFKSALMDTFPDIAEKIIDKLFWVNAMVLYLNVYCGLSQTNIAKLLNISQFGVSKRYRSSKNKIKIILNRPIHSNDKLRELLEKFFPNKEIEPIIVFYSIGLFSMTNRILFNVKYTTISAVLRNAIKHMTDICSLSDEEFIKRYQKATLKDKLLLCRVRDYLEFSVNTQLTGNFLFKTKEYEGRFNFDDKVIFE